DAAAQEEEPQATAAAAGTSGQAIELDRVMVTGSLIPQSQSETFIPATVITAEDIRSRGCRNVAEVLQKSCSARAGVQGSPSAAPFAQGAATVSWCGLPPGYVRYLADGGPMSHYPALHNGCDTFNHISRIPIDLIERIEILPGGQSSLYGS